MRRHCGLLLERQAITHVLSKKILLLQPVYVNFEKKVCSGIELLIMTRHSKRTQSELSSETIMSYYDPKKPTTVMVDGSPVGFGAIFNTG